MIRRRRVSSAQGVSVGSVAMPSFPAGEVRQLQVRLSVSLPALMFLYTIVAVIILHLQLNDFANGVTDSAVRAELESASWWLLVIGIMASLASAAVGVLLAWQIVRPMKALRERMRQVASGELAFAPESTGGLGELGSLGSAFNEMVSDLNNLFARRNIQMRDAADGTVLTLDSSGRVLAADGGARRLLGYEPDVLVGLQLSEALLRDNRYERDSPFLAVIERARRDAADGLRSSHTVAFRPPAREKQGLCSIMGTPLESLHARGPACLLDIRDLTEMQELHFQLQRADRLAAVGTLATGIAHEIRNPLAAIRGMAQLLGEDMDRRPPSETPGSPTHVDSNYAGRIIREVDRLDRLVGNIMDFARSGQGTIEETDLNQLLRDVFETARHRVAPEAATAQPTVTWELAHDLPRVPLDHERLNQGLLNIMINALEALAPTGGELRLRTRLRSEKTTRPIEIIVSNTAPEVSPAEIDKMFEPFHTTKSTGTGLGLPIAYQNVAANRGILEMKWETGMLNCTIRLPLAGAAASIDLGAAVHVDGRWREDEDPPPSA